MLYYSCWSRHITWSCNIRDQSKMSITIKFTCNSKCSDFNLGADNDTHCQSLMMGTTKSTCIMYSPMYYLVSQIYYGSVAKRKAKTPIRKARIHMHKHEMRSGLETELQWNELTAQYDRESPARKAGLDTAIVSVHQRDPTASLPSNTSLLAPSSPKTKRRHSDNPRRQARLS